MTLAPSPLSKSELTTGEPVCNRGRIFRAPIWSRGVSPDCLVEVRDTFGLFGGSIGKEILGFRTFSTMLRVAVKERLPYHFHLTARRRTSLANAMPDEAPIAESWEESKRAVISD